MVSTGLLKSFWDRPRHRGLFFVTSIALLGGLLVGSALAAWQSSVEQQRLFAAHAQTLRILRSAYAVKVATLDTLRGERGFLVTGRAEYLEPYLDGRRDLARNLAELDERTSKHRDSHEHVNQLKIAAAAYLGRIQKIVVLARSGRLDDARDLVRRNGASDGITLIDRAIDQTIDAERIRMRDTYTDVSRATAMLRRFAYVMSFAGLCLIVLAILFAAALRRSLARDRSLRDDLRQQAETDSLTGIANRRQLLEYLDRRIAQARLAGTPLSFALIDIDKFKRVNDSYGHAVGDEAIRHVVRAAQKAVRINDMIGRLGGEEFGIVLPKSSEDNAFLVCDRIRQRLHEQGFVVPGQTVLQLTVSSGIATLTDEDDAASLMARADSALYEAKRNGRDQVQLAA